MYDSKLKFDVTKTLIIASIASLMVVASTSIILYNNPSNYKANAAPIGQPRQVCPNPGTADCDLIRSNQCETHTATDTNNCGGCGNVCPTGSSCTNGQCQCPTGQQACSGACVDTQTSNTNCGACGIACATGATCTGGVCQCPTGQQACSGTCVSLDTNTNCGACGNTCGQSPNPTGSTCQSGACKCPSGQFLSSSGTACVATCGTNEVVTNGQCTACPAGTTADQVHNVCVGTTTKVCTSQGCVGSHVNCPVDPTNPGGATVCKPITQCGFCKTP
jgi:hypothetical protein